MQRVLEEYDLMSRITAVVKDGGDNLATATHANQGLTACKGLGSWAPLLTWYFAHKINGACNAAVLAAKGMELEACPCIDFSMFSTPYAIHGSVLTFCLFLIQSFDFKQIASKLQPCIT
jgi:hypothetical protein